MTLATKFKIFIGQLDGIVQRLIGNNSISGLPALCMLDNPSSRASPRDILADIMDPLMKAIVPRNRRSIERRRTRRNMLPEMANTRPKKNIIVCLECGSQHESQTLCGNCYNKVREATKELQMKLRGDRSMKKNVKEVAFLFKNEDTDDIPKYKGRYLVEVQKDRPEWFPLQLMKKYKGEN
ncbi:RM32-like protein [Mya arenaria]|uniref:Large ribosomal subunit protein bL32m n=1 Tax=Mya arenaria TaxID=6604 RepID=A0ABY7E739_MYAAR|nr:39S ribosomal protein L32, mitochondrial-like [Mya arenaria]WAR04974.1 RM32-like protein [Mya arenaria]